MMGKTGEADFGGGPCLSQDFVSVMRDEALPSGLRKTENYIALNIVSYNRRALQEKGTVY